MTIRQWALATKTGDDLKQFFKNKEEEYILWHCIGGLYSSHSAVIRWKALRKYMDEQEKLFDIYKKKYNKKLISKQYKDKHKGECLC